MADLSAATVGDQSGSSWNRAWQAVAAGLVICLIAAFPYLTGTTAFAPKSILHEGVFRTQDGSAQALPMRDRLGPRDFFDQERNFLRFYRESILAGELPYWNERVFAGISQEDSMIYAWANPLNLPWLIFDNDHTAKGMQVLLVLWIGVGAISWWGVRLGYPGHLIFLAVVLATLSPVMLHAHSHTHYAGSIYWAAVVVATCTRFLDEGRAWRLLLVAFSWITLVVINYATIILFTAGALILYTAARIWFEEDDSQHGQTRQRTIQRAGWCTLCGAAATGACLFLLSPMLHESSLVRDPVSSVARSYLPGLFTGVGFASMMPYTPLAILVALRFYRNWRGASAPTLDVRWMGLLWLLAIVLSASPLLQTVYKSLVPGAKYSNNVFWRFLVFTFPFGALLVAGAFRNPNGNGRRWQLSMESVWLGVLLLANLSFFAAVITPELWRTISPERFNDKIDHLAGDPDSFAMTGLALIIAASLFALWHMAGASARARWLPVLIVGLCFVGLFRLQGPNLPVEHDPVEHPLLEGLASADKRLVSLDLCSGAARSYYRPTATLAGFSTPHGPTDAGLFRTTRRFWAPLNDLNELNQQGASFMEVTWLCREQVLESGVLRGDIAALFRMLGIDYVATGGEVAGNALTRLRANRYTSIYQFAGSWPDVVFIEGVDAQEVSDHLMGLVGGWLDGSETEMPYRALTARRISNHEWVIEVPEDLRGRHGTVFMNHPIEYHRELRVPGSGMLTEAHWAVRSPSLSGGQQAFGLHDAPFRMMSLTLPEGFSIYYNLSNYKLLGGVSLFFLCLLLGIAMYCRRWELCVRA